MRVLLIGRSAVGFRPGGHVSAVAVVIANQAFAATVTVAVHLPPIPKGEHNRMHPPTSEGRGTPESDHYLDKLGQELADSIQRQQDGERTSETFRRWRDGLIDAFDNLTRNRAGFDALEGGPVAEVVPQWIADP